MIQCNAAAELNCQAGEWGKSATEEDNRWAVVEPTRQPKAFMEQVGVIQKEQQQTCGNETESLSLSLVVNNIWIKSNQDTTQKT